MKNARKDDKRYRLFKPGFKSNSEITDKRQSKIESIFAELKVDEDILFSERYSSSNESQSRGNKNPKTKYSSEMQGYQKVYVPGMEIVYLNLRYACVWWILWLIWSKTISSWLY